MAKRRKPISFDTTLRNPERIPKFISVLSEFEGNYLNSDLALKLEAEIIRQKIFEPTKATLGEYKKIYNGKFFFKADDQSESAKHKVDKYYEEWKQNTKGSVNIEKIIYLLKNTITAHKEKNWNGGWESRIHTQFNFLNELGFVRVIKGEKILISENGKLMIREYTKGYPKNDYYDESFEQSAFLIAFSKYQINNPYRKNTIKVNFFPLLLNVILYLGEHYQKNGISKQDLPFIIAWGNNDYKSLADIIYKFRLKFGYNTSDEIVYNYAMNLLDESTPNSELAMAKKSFIQSKQKDYKYEKIMHETVDEIIRKLRLTMLISLRGAGQFIDINKNEIIKIKYIINKNMKNIDFADEKNEYFKHMGAIDNSLIFIQDGLESETQKSIKEKAIENWAQNTNWEVLKNEIKFCLSKSQTNNEILRFVKKTARLEFLSAIIIKKALPNVKIVANYKADDQGIPFHTALGGNKHIIGADIDVYEKRIHAILEPTTSYSRSFQVEHELPSIRNHVIETAKKDMNDNSIYNEWFCLFLATNISPDVGDQVAVIKHINKVEIYPWDIYDFLDYSKDVATLKDYKIIREYVKPQVMPKKK